MHKYFDKGKAPSFMISLWPDFRSIISNSHKIVTQTASIVCGNDTKSNELNGGRCMDIDLLVTADNIGIAK